MFIISEILDIRNRQLAEVTRADDFIVSDSLSSLILSQVSENKELMAVLSDLFDPEGCELYLKAGLDVRHARASDELLHCRCWTPITLFDPAWPLNSCALPYLVSRI